MVIVFIQSQLSSFFNIVVAPFSQPKIAEKKAWKCVWDPSSHIYFFYWFIFTSIPKGLYNILTTFFYHIARLAVDESAAEYALDATCRQTVSTTHTHTDSDDAVDVPAAITHATASAVCSRCRPRI